MTKPAKSTMKSSVTPENCGQCIPLANSDALQQLEEALKTAEENYYSLIEKNSDGIVILDKHVIIYSNRKMDRMTDYTENDLLGKQFLEIVAPECKGILIENYDMTLVDGEPNALAIEIITHNGSKIPVETRAQNIVFKGKPGTMVVIRDISKRKHFEDELKLSEERYKTLFESAANGILIADIETQTQKYANPAICKMLGYTRDELLKLNIEDIHPKGISDRIKAEFKAQASGDNTLITLPCLKKDGTTIYTDISATKAVIDGRECNIGFFTDATERKQAEDALKLSEQNFRSSMDSSTIGIRISDNTDTTCYVNQAFMDIFGYKNIEEIKASPPPEHYSSKSHTEWVKRHEKLLRGEPMPQQVDIDVVRTDGSVRHLDVSMKQVFWNGKQQNQTLYNDITERKLAEEAQHESEAKYRLIVENSIDIIFTLDKLGNFIYVSPSAKKILGYNPQDLVGQPFTSLVHPDDIKTVQTSVQRNIMDGHQTPGGTEYRVRHFSGEWRWHNGTGNGVRDANGAFLYFLGIGRDITEMKRLEQETKKANEQLTSMVKRLEEQQRQSAILTEMRDMLQACSKMEETAPIIMGFMKKLFPTSQGALFLLSNSRSDLESVVTWGNFPVSPENNVFPPDACWGLRRGRAHVVEDASVGPICPHLNKTTPAPYVCLPLMAKGDILGLLHLKNAFSTNGSVNQEIADLRQMATTLSEYLSLSIANVKLSESLSRQSIQDPQTGLYNRRFMEESLLREITRAARKNTPIGIIMGDLDHFKKFNDVYGHAAGDKIISQIGKLFNDKFRGSDIACRYGGEEFLIILPETTLTDTIKRADSLREEIKKMEMVFQGQILGSITMSMGAAAYPDNGTRMDELLRVADTALYKAKQEGRDRVVSG
jgi:diguanylate cyclase (GGDEF)-like protein/PAS domain S-box-containing protein